jgi:molybdopterin-containing oxidoreductase family iron-sulfur binding subunit
MPSLETKTYWRSLADLIEQPGHEQARAYLDQRIPDHQELFGDAFSRRRFMQLMGASIAFAGAAGLAGCRYEKDHIEPEDRRPEGYIPGVPKFYASAMEVGGAAYGLLVTAYDGRPIKVDGNPDHPATGKGSNTWMQASILELYDPDRSRTVERHDGKRHLPASWKDFEQAAHDIASAMSQGGGKGFHVLSEATSSPSVAALKRELLSKYPQARWHEWEPLSHDTEREGMRVAFGRPLRVHLNLDKARVIAAFDADILGDHPDSLRHARDFAAGRDPDGNRTAMNRLYAVESTYTSTGASADHRLPLRSELVKPFLLALEQQIQGGSPAGSGALGEKKVASFLAVLAKDLAENKGGALIAVGHRQPPEVHALAARINDLIAGDTVSYTDDPEPTRGPHWVDLQELTSAMKSGGVDTLFILGGNPVYDAPSGLDFAGALGKVRQSFHLSSYADETSAACSWHLPRAHYLESWGDARTWDGTYTIAQPIIDPIFGARSTIDVLKHLVGRGDTASVDLVKQAFDQLVGGGGELAWRKAVHDGYAPAPLPPFKGSPAKFTTTPLTPTQELGTGQGAGKSIANGQLEICFIPSAAYDGRYANNAWLQEVPDPFTKVTWDNAALVSPKTAKALGIAHEEIIEVTVGDRKAEVVTYVMPGQAPFSIALPIGQGRTRAGHVGGLAQDDVHPVGFDVGPVRAAAALMVSGARVRGTGKHYRLSATTDHNAIDKLGMDTVQKRAPELIKESTLDGYRHDPRFVVAEARTADEAILTDPARFAGENRSLFKEHRYEDHKWGMTTDLTKCTGCNACVIACQSENNVPVVGKEQVWRNREMHWLRIDRYFEGDPDDPHLVNQPILCQQCELAPCEQVCPVEATVHSTEGLNEMVYNRCVGTRYCLNNCPYRVRHFNFLRWDWYKEMDDPRAKVRQLLFNPEVTVRSRGVMEKCTWCVQRIQNVKIKAKNDHRPIRDGEIVTACQQACPTDAITFGDLNDEGSQVAGRQKLPRAYALLAELNTRPRHIFLARITNPHPDLAPAHAEAKAHE